MIIFSGQIQSFSFSPTLFLWPGFRGGLCAPPSSFFPQQEPQVRLCHPQHRPPLVSFGQNEQLETWCLELLKKRDSPM